MPKAELSKHTLNLFPGDYAKLQELYPDVGAATIIRRVVHKFIEQIEEGNQSVPVDIAAKL